jgi:hypothetical protein
MELDNYGVRSVLPNNRLQMLFLHQLQVFMVYAVLQSITSKGNAENV